MVRRGQVIENPVTEERVLENPRMTARSPGLARLCSQGERG